MPSNKFTGNRCEIRLTRAERGKRPGFGRMDTGLRDLLTAPGESASEGNSGDLAVSSPVKTVSEISMRQILAALTVLAVAGSHDAMIARRTSPGRPAARSSTVRIAHVEAASASGRLASPPFHTSLRESPGTLASRHAVAGRTVSQGGGASPGAEGVLHASINTHRTEYPTRP